MTIDPTMQAVIAVLFSTACGAIGWLITRLWTERSTAQDKLALMLSQQFDMNLQRKDLWSDLEKVVEDNSRETADLKRVITELLAEYRRRNP